MHAKTTTLLEKSFWIFNYNLQPLIIVFASMCNYDFTSSDLDAVTYGIKNTDSDSNTWFDYTLIGTKRINLQFSLDSEDAEIIFINVTLDKQFKQELQLLLFMLDTFEFKIRNNIGNQFQTNFLD